MENSTVSSGDNYLDLERQERMPEVVEQEHKRQLLGESKHPPHHDVAVEESGTKVKKLNNAGNINTEEEFEELKRQLYGDETMTIVNCLIEILKDEEEALRAAVKIDPVMNDKLVCYVTTGNRLSQELKECVTKAMKEFGKEVQLIPLDKDCTEFSKLCGETEIWYVRDSKPARNLEVEMLFWQKKHPTGCDAVCVFPFHVMPIKDHPGEPENCVADYNNSSSETMLLARDKLSKKLMVLEERITLHKFLPSNEDPVPEGGLDHLHFGKDIIAAPFRDYNQDKAKIKSLFNMANQEAKVLKLNRENLLRMGSANVAIYGSNLEGYMTCPVIHGVKNYHRYLYVEFLLLRGKLKKGQCGRVIYVKKRDGEQLRIAYFTAKYRHQDGFKRYKAAALSPNLEELEQTFTLYKGDEENSNEDIYEELDLTEKSIKEQFLTKDDLDLETQTRK